LLQRIVELQGKPELTEAEKAELYRLETDWSNHWIDPRECPSRAAESPLAGINERAFLDIVDDERERLLNVLGSLRCIVQAVQSDAAPDEGEIAGAVDLIADQVQRVLDSLEEEALLRTARAGTKAVEKISAASEAARAARS
jgi:hypothetical protein